MPGRLKVSDKSELDILAVLRTLKQIVAEAGEDFVYQAGPTGACYYVVNNEPSCLAARVLHRLGVSVHMLRTWEGESCDLMNGWNGFIGGKIALNFSSESLVVLRIAQMYQDAGRTWGDARDRALEFAFSEYGVTAA